MSFKTAKYLPANSPEARELQLSHLEGFTRHRNAEARKKREEEEQAKEQQKQDDLKLAQAIAGRHALLDE